MINFGVIGAGTIGAVHAGNIAMHPRARLKYVVDLNIAAAKAMAEKHGAQIASLQQALADSELGAVVICTPAHTHAELIVRVARAGKAILCEKPVDLDLKKVDEASKVLAQSKVPFVVAFNRRFDPSHRALRDAIAAGEIGRIEMSIISSRDPEISPPEYVAQMPYGIFYDTMIHDFDIARWLTNEDPTEVFARASVMLDEKANPYRDPDTAMVMLTMPSGALVHVNSSFRAVYGYDQRIEAFGAAGMLISGNHYRSGVERYHNGRVSRDPPFYFFVQRYEEAYRAELNAFISVVEGESAPEIGIEDGRRALIIAYAAAESAKTGRPVTVKY